MKKIVIIYLIVATAVSFGGFFILRSEPVRTFLWKNVNGTQDILENCFVYASSKCGRINYSDEDILEEMHFLELSKQEVRRLILKSKNDDIEELDKLTQRNDLSEDENQRIKKINDAMEYYSRVLRLISQTE